MRARRTILSSAMLALAAGALLVLAVGTAGQAATTQQVQATTSCQPGTVKPGKSTGCLLTVTNIGGNNVNSVTVTDTASAGTFSSSSSSCTASGSTLTCSFDKLAGAGTPGATKSARYELLAPATGSSVRQDFTGRYSSPTGNHRGSDNITFTPPFVTTTLDSSTDFDATFSDTATDSVQTDAISTGNRYSTGATLGTTGFAVGLSLRERAPSTIAEATALCPSGCFGGQVIQFDITPLPDSPYPASFQLTINVYVGPGVKGSDIDVLHTPTGGSTATTVLACSDPRPDPPIDCIASKAIDPSTKIATIAVTGPGSGNGGWGVG
jgi:hypothetical protein